VAAKGAGGLVTLPGASVGALFGASPLATACFQLVVLAAESVAAVVLLRLLAAVPFLPAPGSRWVGLPAAMRQAGGRVHVELSRRLA
jgi:hypothetical protein